MAPSRIIILGVLCFYLSHFLAEGGNNESADVVTTIQTEDGLYDCYDFYKQPTFKHPLLQEHSYHPEMKPFSVPDWVYSNSNNDTSDEDISSIIMTVDCPDGSIPIRRLNKDGEPLQYDQVPRDFYSHLGKDNYTQNNSNGRTYFGVIQSDESNSFHGVGSLLSVWNPSGVKNNQYTSGEIIVKSSEDVLVAGWTVNPMVYKDTRTRLFTYAVAQGMHCFNAHCGFVHVNKKVALDAPIQPTSTRLPMKIYHYGFFIYQDKKDNGDWWLAITSKRIPVGFWPNKIFNGLSYEALYAACGGEAYGPTNIIPPVMGNGVQPRRDAANTWPYCRDTTVINENHKPVVYNNFKPFATDNKDYFVIYYDKFNIAAYGGPGHFLEILSNTSTWC